jgi:hypothetical protein
MYRSSAPGSRPRDATNRSHANSLPVGLRSRRFPRYPENRPSFANWPRGADEASKMCSCRKGTPSLTKAEASKRIDALKSRLERERARQPALRLQISWHSRPFCDAGANHGEPYSRQMRCPARCNTTYVRSTNPWQRRRAGQKDQHSKHKPSEHVGHRDVEHEPNLGQKQARLVSTWVRRRARRKKVMPLLMAQGRPTITVSRTTFFLRELKSLSIVKGRSMRKTGL